MTIINKFIEYTKFISTRKDISMKILTHILIDEMIKNYKMLETIISNKDKSFIFKF